MTATDSTLKQLTTCGVSNTCTLQHEQQSYNNELLHEHLHRLLRYNKLYNRFTMVIELID